MAVELNSILLTTAPSAGVSSDYLADDDSFTTELITDINSHLNKLNQIGIGVPGFHIEGSSETWSDFYGDVVPPEKQWMVREYVKHAVKKSFDPPNSGILQSQLDSQLQELEFRLLVGQQY